MAKEVNHLENKTITPTKSIDISTEKKVTALTQDLKIVSTTDFFEKMMEMCNKGDNSKSPQCVKCEEQFEDQK